MKIGIEPTIQLDGEPMETIFNGSTFAIIIKTSTGSLYVQKIATGEIYGVECIMTARKLVRYFDLIYKQKEVVCVY